MVLYKQYFKEMLEQNKELFANFKLIHDDYLKNPESIQDNFNLQGKAVVEVIRHWENKLCGKTERGTYSRYSANLSEKFRAEIKKIYPKIDFVGVKFS